MELKEKAMSRVTNLQKVTFVSSESSENSGKNNFKIAREKNSGFVKFRKE